MTGVLYNLNETNKQTKTLLGIQASFIPPQDQALEE